MIVFQFIPLIVKQVTRQRLRTLLTVGGVATAMFLFIGVEAMQAGVRQATEVSAADTALIVYREDRYCPFSSRLPQYYERRIEELDGVVSAVPMKIVVNNCRASLDVVTFRGMPTEAFRAEILPRITMLDGSFDDWARRSDAVLIGETLAQRRGFRVGQRFEAAGINAYVAGMYRSEEPEDQNVAYAHLEFLQQAQSQQGLGVVTQFRVRVADAARLDDVSAAIDELFRSAEDPTTTRAEKAFLATIAADVIEIIHFSRLLGLGCLVAVLALIANSIILAVQDRIKEHAILQTLGYRNWMIAALIICEGALVGVIGALVGAGLALAVIQWTGLTVSMEGVSILIPADPMLAVKGLGIALLLSVLAGLVPAWQASRREIASCFRAV